MTASVSSVSSSSLPVDVINESNVIGFKAVVSATYPTLDTIIVSDSVRSDFASGGITLLAKNMACADTYRFQAYLLVFVTEGIGLMPDVKVGNHPSPQKTAISDIAKKLSTDSRASVRQQWLEFSRLAIAAIHAGVDISNIQSMSALRNTKTPKVKPNVSDVDAFNPILIASQEAQEAAATAVRASVEADAIRKDSEEKALERERDLNVSIGNLQSQVRKLENDSQISGDALQLQKSYLALANEQIAFMESIMNKAQLVKLESWKQAQG